jgi:hypothetical protein
VETRKWKREGEIEMRKVAKLELIAGGVCLKMRK